MPLNFEEPPLEPTLGRAKSKEEMKRRIKIKKSKVTEGLREQGGTSWSFSGDVAARRDEYAKLIQRQTEQATAQFGYLPKGWQYVTFIEVDEMLRGMGSSGTAFLKNRTPTIRIDRERSLMAYRFTLTAGELDCTFRTTDEQIVGSIGGIENTVYELNHHVRNLAQSYRMSGEELRDRQKYYVMPVEDNRMAAWDPTYREIENDQLKSMFREISRDKE